MGGGGVLVLIVAIGCLIYIFDGGVFVGCIMGSSAEFGYCFCD